MANQSFDTVILNPLERPLSSDLNAAQSELQRALRDYLSGMYSRSLSDTAVSTPVEGFVADGLRVVPPAVASLAVALTKGMGFAPNPSPQADVSSIGGLNDLSTYAPLPLSDTQAITLNAAPGAGLARVDLIQVRVNRRLTDSTPRDIFNASTLSFGSVNINKTMTFDLLGQTGTVIAPAVGTTGISYKVGTTFAYPANDFDSATALAARPAVDPGYIPVAYINVTPSMAAVIEADIIDMRPLLLGPAAMAPLAARVSVFGTSSLPAGRRADVTTPAFPPGIKVAVTKDGAAAQSYIFYVFVGDGNDYRLNATLQSTLPTSGGLFDNVAEAGATPVSGTVSAALQANLADANKTSPTVDVAIGQGYIAVGLAFSSLSVSGATIVANPLAGTDNGNNPYALSAILSRKA